MVETTVRKRCTSRVQIVWILLLALLGGTAVVEYWEVGGNQHHSTITPARSLLPISNDQIGAVELADGQQTHRFERNEQGAWIYHSHDHSNGLSHQHGPNQPSHDADPAFAQRIQKALTVLGRARIERQFEFDANVSDYGVLNPKLLVNIYPLDKMTPIARYAVGNIAPDTFSRYVLLVGSFTIVTIPNYHIDNLLELIQTSTINTAAQR